MVEEVMSEESEKWRKARQDLGEMGEVIRKQDVFYKKYGKKLHKGLKSRGRMSRRHGLCEEAN